jgi:hypothetical protein
MSIWRRWHRALEVLDRVALRPYARPTVLAPAAPSGSSTSCAGGARLQLEERGAEGVEQLVATSGSRRRRGAARAAGVQRSGYRERLGLR